MSDLRYSGNLILSGLHQLRIDLESTVPAVPQDSGDYFLTSCMYDFEGLKATNHRDKDTNLNLQQVNNAPFRMEIRHCARPSKRESHDAM